MTQFYSARKVQKALMNKRAFQFSHPDDTRWSQWGGSVTQQCKLDSLSLISRTHVKVGGENWLHRELLASFHTRAVIHVCVDMCLHTQKRKNKDGTVSSKGQKAGRSWNKKLTRHRELGKAEENSSGGWAPCTGQTALHMAHPTQSSKKSKVSRRPVWDIWTFKSLTQDQQEKTCSQHPLKEQMNSSEKWTTSHGNTDKK